MSAVYHCHTKTIHFNLLRSSAVHSYKVLKHGVIYIFQAGPLKQSAALVANSYEWKDELFGCDFLAAPVSLFKHAPLHEMWDNTFEGMKVEVKNTDSENYSEKLSDYFWVATVLKVCK